jgi:hypothetical protein
MADTYSLLRQGINHDSQVFDSASPKGAFTPKSDFALSLQISNEKKYFYSLERASIMRNRTRKPSLRLTVARLSSVTSIAETFPGSGDVTKPFFPSSMPLKQNKLERFKRANSVQKRSVQAV